MNLTRGFLLLCCYSFFSTVAYSQEQSFAAWLQELRTEASALGVSDSALAALDQLEAPLERVLELDSSQPEFVQTFTRYLSLRITSGQINRGRSLLRQHAVLLEEVRNRYGRNEG